MASESNSCTTTTTTTTTSSSSDSTHRSRVWLDGCFDLFHYGHANAIRQAKLAGDVLVVGVHSDDEIQRCKGLPVMNWEERLAVVHACKWVDEVVTEAPYVTSLAVLDKYSIDYCVHGEDISTDENGVDSFQEVKQAGKFRLIKRTDGVSTTDVLARMLLMSKKHFQTGESIEGENEIKNWREDVSIKQFLTTSRKIVQFSSGKAPKPGDRVIYVDGAFDLFHIGHINFLKKAREMGDFLIAGIHTDQDVNARKGVNYPIMNLHERVLVVLSCKYVDEVIIGSPYTISDDMISSLNLHAVVHGDEQIELMPDEPDPYRIPKEKGIYHELAHTPGINTETIVKRIVQRRLEFEESNQKKKEKNSKIKPAAVPTEVLQNY